MGASAQVTTENIGDDLTQKALNDITQKCTVKGGNASVSGNKIVVDNSKTGNIDLSASVKVSATCALKNYTDNNFATLVQNMLKADEKQGALQIGIHVQDTNLNDNTYINQAFENFIAESTYFQGGSAIVDNNRITIENSTVGNIDLVSNLSNSFVSTTNNTVKNISNTSAKTAATSGQHLENLFPTSEVIVAIIVGGIVAVGVVVVKVFGKSSKSGKGYSSSYGKS